MSGTPLWLRLLCSPLGVMMPSSLSIGVSAAPVPGARSAYGRKKWRTTGCSKREGCPYPLNGAPYTRSQGLPARLCAFAPGARPAEAATPATAAPRARKVRRSIVPGGSETERPIGVRLVRSLWSICSPSDNSHSFPGLLGFGQLLERERVARVVERFVAGEACGLVHARPV